MTRKERSTPKGSSTAGSSALSRSPSPEAPSPGSRPHDSGESSADEDRFLIERSRYGDVECFERLVNKYQQRSLCIARKIVFDQEAARDVSQEAFLRLYKSLDKYDPAQRFYTWFYRIVVHLAIDHVRRNKNQPQRLGDREDIGWFHRDRPNGVAGADPRQPAPDAGMQQDETRQRIYGVLAQLPQKYRILLVLRDLEGFTSKEISDIANWNHATVRWRLHRARKLFRQVWEEAGYEGV